MTHLSWSPPSPTIELYLIIGNGLRLAVKSIRESSLCPACHHVSSARIVGIHVLFKISLSPINLFLFCLFPENGFVILLFFPLKCLLSDMNGFLLMVAVRFVQNTPFDKLLFLPAASLHKK
jgi:hypothetical protein